MVQEAVVVLGLSVFVSLLLAAFDVIYDRGGACLPREVASAAEGTCETSGRAARTRS